MVELYCQEVGNSTELPYECTWGWSEIWLEDSFGDYLETMRNSVVMYYVYKIVTTLPKVIYNSFVSKLLRPRRLRSRVHNGTAKGSK